MSLSNLTSFIDNSLNKRISTCHSSTNLRRKVNPGKSLTLSTSPSYLSTVVNVKKTIETNQSFNLGRSEYESTLNNLDKEISKLEKKRSYAKFNTLKNMQSKMLYSNPTETNIFNKQRSNYYNDTRFYTISQQIRKSKELTIKKELKYIKDQLLNEPNSTKLLINPPIAFTETNKNKMIISKLGLDTLNNNKTMKFIKYCSPVQRKQVKTINNTGMFSSLGPRNKGVFLPVKYPVNFREKNEIDLFYQAFKTRSRSSLNSIFNKSKGNSQYY